MAKDRAGPPAGTDEEEEQGSWHLRSGGAWVFGLVLWLAGVGGMVLFAQDGVEVALARWHGIEGTVTIQNCAHTKSYALCYGPFDAKNGSVHVKRLELRTIRHDQPGRHERTWLGKRSATYAWASDVNPWSQLIPAAPFALLALVQTWWLTSSLRAWRRRRKLAKRRKRATPWAPGELGRPAPADAPGPPGGYPPMPPGPYPPVPTSGGHLPPGAYPPQPPAAYPPGEPGYGAGDNFPTAAYPFKGRVQAPDLVPPTPGRVYRSDPIQPEYREPEHPPGHPARDGWQDRRSTAAPPAPSVPQPRARRPQREKPEDG